MPSPVETPRPFPSRILLVLLLAACGFAATVAVFYPGIVTFDTRFVYQDIAKGTYGDWQSPVMTVLWRLIDPLAPGPASMFLATALLYWTAFAIIAATIVERSRAAAIVMLALALSPPAFMLLGVIWRDVLLAAVVLLAAACTLAAAGRGTTTAILFRIASIALVLFCVLLRPNALFAAAILLAYALWPMRLTLRRLALAAIPLAALCFGLVQVVYYGILHAERQHPLHSIMVFDLGGITHFTGANQFPVTWPPDQQAQVLSTCYHPTEWDIYWRLDPCRFVMAKLEGDKIFGTPALTRAWLDAVTRHPLAYLEHRAAFTWNFWTGNNLTMWTYDIDHPPNNVFPDRPVFNALLALHDTLKPTPLSKPGFWLAICLLVTVLTMGPARRPGTAFAFALCGSASVYVLTLVAVGVASDYRYGYVAVLAAIAGVCVLAARLPQAE